MPVALITGGAGFIGSYLATALVEQGYEVQVIDDFSTGLLENIHHLVGRPRFSYVNGTALDRSAMAKLMDRTDLVFHLAAAVGVRMIVERPIHTIEANVKATEVVLELAAQKGTKVIVSSTSEVYGKLKKERFGEGDELVLGPPTRARWSYAASKIIDEFLTIAYSMEKALPVVIVRIFNAIGPRQTSQYGMVVPSFVQQALAEEAITVYGDGTQRRSFTWVEDVVNAMVSLSQNPEATGEVFNVGHTKDISITELAVMVKEMTGSHAEIVHVPYEQAYGPGFEDMPRRLPDISKIQRFIEYRPTLDLPDMLDRIIAHERSRLPNHARP